MKFFSKTTPIITVNVIVIKLIKKIPIIIKNGESKLYLNKINTLRKEKKN